MWVFYNDSFLSIVENKDGFPNGDRRNRLLVRSRKRDDILAVFPDAKVWHDPKADYHWRTIIRRRDVANAMYRRVFTINYGNFKNSVVDDVRHNMLTRIWSTVNAFFNPPLRRAIFGDVGWRPPVDLLGDPDAFGADEYRKDEVEQYQFLKHSKPTPW